jgi:broad specificity phosphatase PhoE
MRRMLSVTLIRHGQSVSNTVKRFGSQNDVPLSPTGRLQAQLTGDALASQRVTRIIASDLSRAADTAKAVANRTRVKVELFPELRERDVGVLTGLTFQEAQSRHPEHFDALYSGDPTRKIGGAESYADVAQRADALLERILPETKGHLVIVSHMVVLQHLLRKACRVDESCLRGAVTFSIENAALHRLRYYQDDRRWHIFGTNETDHLRSVQAGDQLSQ